jgi:hypothetical protein
VFKAGRSTLYVVTGTRGIACWRPGVWKLKCYRGKAIKGLCLMYGKLQESKYVIFGCGETAGCRMNLKCEKWLNYHEFIIRKIINCNNSFFVKDIGNCLFNVKGNWMRHMEKK